MAALSLIVLERLKGKDRTQMLPKRPRSQNSSAQALPLTRQDLDCSLIEVATAGPINLSHCIRAFVARKSGVRLEDIKPESRLLHDLAIDGDQAADLLVEFATSLEVDMDGFTFAEFFHDRRPRFRFWPFGNRRLLPLTVEDLYQSAQRRKFTHGNR